MARPRKWTSDAERMAARRVNEQGGRVNEHVPAVNEQPDRVNEHDVRIETVNEQRAEPMDDEARTQTPGFVAFRDCPDVPHDCRADPWIGAGRGTVRTYRGSPFVLVARGDTDPSHPEHGVVTAADWHARQHQHCAHGLAGWSCHAC